MQASLRLSVRYCPHPIPSSPPCLGLLSFADQHSFASCGSQTQEMDQSGPAAPALSSIHRRARNALNAVKNTSQTLKDITNATRHTFAKVRSPQGAFQVRGHLVRPPFTPCRVTFTDIIVPIALNSRYRHIRAASSAKGSAKHFTNTSSKRSSSSSRPSTVRSTCMTFQCTCYSPIQFRLKQSGSLCFNPPDTFSRRYRACHRLAQKLAKFGLNGN